MSTQAAGEAPGVREDPSGELRDAMRRVIAEGSALEAELYLSEDEHLDRHLHSIETWRIGCVTLLRSAFEREAVAELLRATSSASRPARARSAAQMQRRRVKDALELLQALEGTLDARGGFGRPRGHRERRSAGA